MSEAESTTGEGENRRRNAGITAARRARQAYKFADYMHRLWSLLGTKTGVLAVSTVTTMGVATKVAVTQPEVFGLAPPPGLTTIQTRTLGKSSLIYPVEGVDSEGRRVLFDLVVLSPDLAWLKGSDREIALAGRTLGATEIVPQVLGPELIQSLSGSKEVIAVGVASIEGEEATETQRAGRRAETAAGWIRKAIPIDLPLSTLNLGQFRSSCSGRVANDTAWQRPLMVVAVRRREPGAQTAAALANALEGKSNVPGPDCYTSFRFARQP